MAGGMQGGAGDYDYSSRPISAPTPVRKRGGNGCLIWGLVGCGGLMVLMIVLSIIAAVNMGKNKNVRSVGNIFKNAMTAPMMAPKLRNIKSALQGYRNDHQGKYPPSLETLAPGYLPNKSDLIVGEGSSVRADYTPPTSQSSESAPVVSFDLGESTMSFGGMSQMNQRIYVRLLKNGRIVSDQIQRTDLVPTGSND